MDFNVNPSSSPPNNNTRSSAVEVAFEGHGAACEDGRRLLEKNNDEELVATVLKDVNVARVFQRDAEL